jgi:hypothetical protein
MKYSVIGMVKNSLFLRFCYVSVKNLNFLCLVTPAKGADSFKKTTPAKGADSFKKTGLLTPG